MASGKLDAMKLSLIARMAKISSMEFWMSGDVVKVGVDDDGRVNKERRRMCGYDAMINEVCCAFSVSDEGFPVCNVGVDVDIDNGSFFLVVWLNKDGKEGCTVHVHRPLHSLPDVRVFHGDVFDGRKMGARCMMLRGDTVPYMLGGGATFSIEGSILQQSVLRMRFIPIPSLYDMGEGRISGKRFKTSDNNCKLPFRSIADPARRMGDLQHIYISKQTALLSRVDAARLRECMAGLRRADGASFLRGTQLYGMSNSIVPSALGVRYFTHGIARTSSSHGKTRLFVHDDEQRTLDARNVYLHTLRSFCSSPPPLEMLVEPQDSALAHAMDIIHCPSPSTSCEIPWDILEIHKCALEREASGSNGTPASIASVGLLLSMAVKQPLRCFPRGIVYHTVRRGDCGMQATDHIVTLAMHMMMHERDQWVLPIQLSFHDVSIERPLKRTYVQADEDHMNITVGRIGCKHDVDSEMVDVFTPLPLSMRAYIEVLLGCHEETPTMPPLPTREQPPCDVVVQETPTVHIQLVNADSIVVYAARDVIIHMGWVTILRLPMTQWQQSTIDLLLISLGCVAVLPLASCDGASSSSIDSLHGRVLSLVRTAPLHFSFVANDMQGVTLGLRGIRHAGVDENFLQFAWLQRGMLHITPEEEMRLTMGRSSSTDQHAQTAMFSALSTLLDDLDGNARMIRMDVDVHLHEGALSSFCALLSNANLIAFQGRSIVFDSCCQGHDVIMLYAKLATACASLYFVEFGDAMVNVNVRACPSPISMVGVHDQVVGMRDAITLMSHLTEQEQNQQPTRQFLDVNREMTLRGVNSIWHHGPQIQM
jgi:hypothetical protein